MDEHAVGVVEVAVRDGDFDVGMVLEAIEAPESGRAVMGCDRSGSAPQAPRHEGLVPRLRASRYSVDVGEHGIPDPCGQPSLDGAAGEPEIGGLGAMEDAVLDGGLGMDALERV